MTRHSLLITRGSQRGSAPDLKDRCGHPPTARDFDAVGGFLRLTPLPSSFGSGRRG
ncbi:hypothetical protein MESS2_50035 [Mesorhizobium metallidurans STM 2683]|uniref:Uncharacterized protein n=1 Tax=Mesorhizobium metallidurans STM 2683 TaxID=1297569 RepID=M5EQW4_9HYPH|nr:hypothetical protein MESS2_50035 [Mesorhizobium metallidurans STM 2683]